jgi:hypothetical protein
MNIFNLLTKEKHVAGVEIDESVVRIAFFRPKKESVILPSLHTEAITKEENELILVEEVLPEGLVREGVVIDPEALGQALSTIWAKARLGTHYAIVAIPDDKIYSRIFTFPKALDEERIGEAMDLATSFQLPFEQAAIYSDWEIVGKTDTSSEVLFSAIPKEITQGFVTAFTLAGIKPLALESHLDSIARSIEGTQGIPVLYTKETETDASIFVVKDGYTRFSRAVPTRFVPKNKFKGEVEKIKASFESSGTTMAIQNIETAKIKADYLQFEELSENKSVWFVALGAAIRGTLPEGNDNLISLLPVKMEEAYSYQKAVTFTILVRNMTMGVAVFFTASFLAMYFVMLSLSQTANRSMASLSATPTSSELLAQEAVIKNVNELTLTTTSILSQTPVWSLLLDEFSKRIIPGITINSFAAHSLTEEITVSGQAMNREVLNQFKKTLQDSPMFTDVQLPITNLEQKESIPFSLRFKIRDPSTLYYK